jgi:uncharacterized protein
MDKSEVIKKLMKYKLLVSEHFDISNLVLFGSYAKGNPREDSDIDVAIVVDIMDKPFFSYAPVLWKLRREIDDRIEPILLEKDNDKSGFLQEVLETGVMIP